MTNSGGGPIVSVIIPHFNRADLLTATVTSVREQSYPHWEALIIDDGSDLLCRNQVKALAGLDHRFRLLERDRQPKGANTCRNIGVKEARGDYLVFLDSDDLLAPFCLAQRVKEIQNRHECDYVIFQVEKFRHVPGDTGLTWNITNEEDHLTRFLRLDSVWHTTGPIWRKEAVQKLNGFDERLTCLQDVDIHVRALAAGLGYCLCFDHPADSAYRIHEADSISQKGFYGRDKLESLATFFKNCITLSTCMATPDRMSSLSQTARGVAFKLLETRQFDLYEQIVALAKQNKLIAPCMYARLKSLYPLFRMGGYNIKGMHRLKPYFKNWLDLQS